MVMTRLFTLVTTDGCAADARGFAWLWGIFFFVLKQTGFPSASWGRGREEGPGGSTTHVVDDLELERSGVQVIQLACTRGESSVRGSAPRLHPARAPPKPPLTAELQDLAVQVAVAAVGRLLGLGQGGLGGAGGEADLGPGLKLLQGLQAAVRHQGLRGGGVRDKGYGGLGTGVAGPQEPGPAAEPGSLTCLSSARRFCSSESLSWPQWT